MIQTYALQQQQRLLLADDDDIFAKIGVPYQSK